METSYRRKKPAPQWKNKELLAEDSSFYTNDLPTSCAPQFPTLGYSSTHLEPCNPEELLQGHLRHRRGSMDFGIERMRLNVTWLESWNEKKQTPGQGGTGGGDYCGLPTNEGVC
ncbi:unnamed protein product [Caretta caretta]